MANVPGCIKLEPASVWINYIFRHNAAPLCVLIIFYVFILSIYILYTKQMAALSSLKSCITNLTTSSFYQHYYLPHIHHYCSKFPLFVVLLPISLMYFDSLFRYRNDCSSTTNSWIIFSIIFLIQFWYISIKTILFSPHLPPNTPQNETVIDEADHAFIPPSLPSMNAPKPMQQELHDDYEENANYGNPFDSDNDENDNKNDDYIVIQQQTANIPIAHHQAPVVNDESSNNTPQYHDDNKQQIPPPPPPLPTTEYIGNGNTVSTESIKAFETKQLITYIKYTTIFFMILSLFLMVTLWRFIPYFAFNISAFTLFYMLLTPFILIYRMNVRLMNTDYSNYYYRMNILNDIPCIVFLLKLSSFFIILTFCMTLSVHNKSALSAVLYLLLPICSIYSWKVLCQISLHLELMYDTLKKRHSYIGPLIPFGDSTPTEDHNEERNTNKPIEKIDDLPEAGNLDRLESIELGVDEQNNVTEFEAVVARTTYMFWIGNKICFINAFISFIAGAAEISAANGHSVYCVSDNQCFITNAFVWYSAATLLVMYSVLLLLIIIYNVFVALFHKARGEGIHALLHLIGSDTKGRLLVFFNTNLLSVQLNLILATDTNGAKAIITILSIITSVMLALTTLNKQYKALRQIQVKYPNVLAICYMISYIVSIFVMFLLMIHVNAVNDKQFLMIYSYIGLPFIWLIWSQLYNNEMRNFISELNDKRSESIPTTYGSLYLLNELCMISSFMVFVICCAMASKSYDGAQDGASLFFLFIYLLSSLVMFINSFIAILCLQPQKEKKYKVAMFEPVLQESLLSQH